MLIGRGKPAPCVVAAGRLHFHDVRAQVAEGHADERPREHARKIDDGNALERSVLSPPQGTGDPGSLGSGIASEDRNPDDSDMGDGRTFGQALRALDKFIVEQSRRDATQVPDPNSPIRRAYERIVAAPAQ